MLNCLIIDDEPLAREGLSNYINEVNFLKLIGTCEHPMEAIKTMSEKQPDLLFLDIQMPKLSGLDFLRSLQSPPLTIITTAYPSFALEGFQLDVLDYLVKPITFERFFKASHKAKTHFELLQKSDSRPSHKDGAFFFIKSNNKYEKIRLDDLLFVEAMQNYITLHTTRGKFTTLLSMKNILEELPALRFLQVHKSYIVALDKIETLEGNLIQIKQNKIPISRAKRELVVNKVVKGKLLKR